MPSLLVRCMLFFSSYFPLMLIFSILLWRSNLPWALSILILALFSLLVTFLFIGMRKSRGGVSQAKITGVEKRDENVVSYIATYLIPFVTFPLATPEQAAAILILVAVLLILYVNSNMIYVNPMLNLVGWHLYSITINTDQVPHYLIARQDIRPNSTLYFVEISTNVYLEKKVKKTI
ncbi:hypothetical protein [Ktedonobacter robiniae]|uniref:Uncharacterized protein n=1 Tax=Ktedonobacter robiniae TaxID=2778365 RepID=A0ABQ3UTA7_9CHLR|nr:hypothetical protein [Ktedonobacter robiniae]GHO56069.1 hypothetical protein KSB_45440 [Ktedonobacter robiniae]